MFALMVVGMVILWAAIVSAVLSYFILSWGFVVTKLWSWFLVAPFGFAAITFSQAVAIMIILGTVKTFVNPEYDSLMKISEKDIDETNKAAKWTKLAMMVAMPWLSLIVTWLVKIIFIA